MRGRPLITPISTGTPRWIRYKTPRMEQQFAHLSPEYMAGAVDKLDGIIGRMWSEKRRVNPTESPEIGYDAA